MDGREERLTRAVYQIGAERGRRRVAPPNPFSDGMIISVDKPLGWTSFDLVNLFRRLACTELNLKRLKVGHAGTLDPLATGVVVLCTGRFTKRIEELQDHDKCYEATIRLGATTPSFDLEHSIDAFFPYDHLTEEEIRTALRSYEGEIDQVPPAYSAAKIGGARGSSSARWLVTWASSSAVGLISRDCVGLGSATEAWRIASVPRTLSHLSDRHWRPMLPSTRPTSGRGGTASRLRGRIDKINFRDTDI